mmetsp:Transcript_19801/g.41247  ORF Transcript_19801/g.41247 Transcript_19801/m.41247 type:complete len:115 (+) Transcript_19801:176-520(+)
MKRPSGFTALLCSVMFLSSTLAFVQTNNGAILPKSTPLHMTVLTANGKKIDFKEGSSLSAACAKLGVKPKYSCKKGDCGSCTVSVGGSRIKACVGKVPPMPRLKSLQEKGLEIK